MLLSFGHRIQASDKGTKDPATPPRPRPFREDPRYRSAASTTPETEPATRSVPSRSFHPPTHARTPLSSTRLSSPRFSPSSPPPTLSTCCCPPRLPTLAIPLYDALIIPNIDGSTCSPARPSSPACNGRIRGHLPGQADSPSSTSATHPAERYCPRLFLPSVRVFH